MVMRINSAFTLFEFLLVLMMSSIMLMLSIPSYRIYLRKTWRSEAQVALLEASSRLEQYAAVHGNYADATFLAIHMLDITASQHYRLHLQIDSSGEAYQLSADPVDSEAGNRVELE